MSETDPPRRRGVAVRLHARPHGRRRRRLAPRVLARRARGPLSGRSRSSSAPRSRPRSAARFASSMRRRRRRPVVSTPVRSRSPALREAVEPAAPGRRLPRPVPLLRTRCDEVLRGERRRLLPRRPRQEPGGAGVTPHDDHRPNDPLDLEALPGQRPRRWATTKTKSRPSVEPRAPDTKGRGRDESDKLDQYLLRRYHLYGDRKAREQLITMYLPLVRSLARRYASRGEHFDDLVQVGAIGLIKAIDRFDLERGVELTTYATPNIVGEIKRYFRDKGWSVRVPRGLQELNIRLNKVIDELVPKLQRSPTINEIAEAAERDARRGARGARDEPGLQLRLAAGLAQRRGRRRRDAGLIDYLASDEEAYDTMEDRTTLAPGFAKLDKRERYILHLRFFEGLTQSRRSPSASASRRCTSRASSAARSRSCARRSATSTTPTPRCSPVAASSGAGDAGAPAHRHPVKTDRRIDRRERCRDPRPLPRVLRRPRAPGGRARQSSCPRATPPSCSRPPACSSSSRTSSASRRRRRRA